ncbi:MAG: FlgD immunoglobulin-like domain containing protein, partial [Armatimonadota bacterium]
TAYSYDSGEGGSRRFRLEIADRDGAGLMITGASAGGAGPVTVSYTLSAQAQVGIEVLNIAGRRVTTLASGEPQAAGVQSVAWNGRSSAGTLCPAGRYLVRINARADSGQQVQALVPLSLER